MDSQTLPTLSLRHSRLRRWLNRLEYRLLPGLCLRCGLASERELDLCEGCEKDFIGLDHCCHRCAVPLPTPEYRADAVRTVLCGPCLSDPPAFARVLAAYRYEEPLSPLVIRAKTQRNLATLQVLGTLLATSLTRRLADQQLPDVLIPVPLHWRRRLDRGYNQALELARPVALALNIPLQPGLVRRTHYRTQQGLGRDERMRQLRGAFQVKSDVANLRVAVIDDVVTTTGTGRALSKALLAAGAARVEIWCLARTPQGAV